jgi:hypothetical protein
MIHILQKDSTPRSYSDFKDEVFEQTGVEFTDLAKEMELIEDLGGVASYQSQGYLITISGDLNSIKTLDERDLKNKSHRPKFELLDPGKFSLIQQDEDGRILQIGLTESQSEMLQISVALISNKSPVLRLGKEHDLILKKTL